MRARDMRALLRGVNDDALIVVVDNEGHWSPQEWRHVHEVADGDGQVLLMDNDGPDASARSGESS